MTSSKNAVSLLTAAALVVAPVGGVAATYDTGYADDGDDKGKDEDGSLAIPDSAEQAIEWIQSGELTKEAALDKAWADGKIADVDIDKLRQYLKDYLEAVAEQEEAEARAEAEAKAAKEKAEREAAEKAAAEAKAEAEKEAAEKAAAEKAAAEKEAAEKAEREAQVQEEQKASGVAGVTGEEDDSDDATGSSDDASAGGETSGKGDADREPVPDATIPEKPAPEETAPAEPVADIEVPDITGMTADEAKQALEEKGLKLSEKEPVRSFHDTVKRNGVISQSPAAGTKVAAGASVDILEISDGPAQFAMPDLSGLNVDAAMDAIKALGLTVSEEAPEHEYSDTVAAGGIIRTTPAAGDIIPAGSAVKFVISDGAKPADPEPPQQPDTPDTPEPAPEPEEPAKPSEPVDTDNPVDSGQQKPSANGAGGNTSGSHTAAVNKGHAQTPLKQVAVKVPSISFTHMDNSSYVARHYSEDLTTEKFISLVGESARSIAAESDLYASVMIAQAILESASGNSTLAQAPNNNLFGIKGTYKGNSVQLPTREDDGSGSTYTINADFRQYDTVEESLSDYADLLSNSMGDFYAGARKSNTDSFVDACDFLVGRYATDIFYSEKLQDLIETYDLTRFDVPLTYEMTETFVLPVKDDVTGLDLVLDPEADKEAYNALVEEYRAYVDANQEYQASLREWEAQMAAAEELYHVPVYLEKPSAPTADTPMQQHQNEIDAARFEGFEELIEKGEPLPVREARDLNDLTTLATSFLGVPYLWGGTTPNGFDCSGLVQYCYREVFNIELPRTTYYQCEVGTEVPFEELLPGDLLFFDDGGDVHHVAMYLGDGYYVEAPHTGDVVKITAMNDKLPDFAKRVVEARDIDLSEYSDEQLAMFVEREKYLQEREQRLGVTDEALEELTEWLQGLEF
ncbi:PASTA domain-containing protein [Eggerthellaceae bacterium 24-137]